MSDVLPQLGSSVCTTIVPVQYATSSGSMSRLDPSGNISTLGVYSSFCHLFYCHRGEKPFKHSVCKVTPETTKKDFSPGHSKQCVLK